MQCWGKNYGQAVKNPKEDSKWEHRPPGFLGQWQCYPGYLAVPKHSNPKYWPIRCATLTPPLIQDSIPAQPILYKPHPEWVVVAQCREEILHHPNAKIVERYNKYTNNLPLLQTGDTVTIQSLINHRWNITRKIITALPDWQYWIRVDGSGRITLRNRRFLRKCKLKPAPTPILSTTPGPITTSSNA